LFRHFGKPIASRAHALGPGLDIRADGGFIVAPPSLHLSGHRYEWDAASDPANALIAPLPAWIWDLAGTTTVHAPPPMQTPSPLLFGGKSVPTYVGTCSLTGEEITGLFRHPDIALACARALNLPTGKIGQTLHCILHDDRHPSASLYWDPKTGALKYRDWHRKGETEWYTLADVYASTIAGRVMRLPGPSMASWFLRLLVEAGMYRPVAVPARRLPSTVRPAVRKVYEGFLLLLGCKWLHTPGDPTPFSWRFAADWCGISERHAGESIRWLLQEGYIRQVGKHRGTALFLPVPPHEEAK
jgi:Bifunctional DNA primase/polymerase, N-terminal